MPFHPSPRSLLAAFDHVEADLSEFLARVPLVSEHLSVWSPSLVRCILDACSQLDSLWKLRSGTRSNLTIAQHFAVHGARVADEWLVVWDGDGFECRPFTGWSKKKKHVQLPWWQAYNSLKHNRWEYVKEATLMNAVDAAGALFLAIALDAECHSILAERKWLHSQFATDWIIGKLSTKPGPECGVTIESTLFSYAVGSSDPDLRRKLAYYHQCTRRFGKWLEKKYSREFWIG